MKEIIAKYTKLFQHHLISWINIYGLDINNDNLLEMNEIIPKYINNIINNGHHFILTNDYINYLCFYACYRQKYGDKGNKTYYLTTLYSKLDYLASANEEDIDTSLYNYYHFLLFGKELSEYSKFENFLNLMNKKEQEMISICMDIRPKLWDISYRYYEYEILKRVLIKIAYYCKKNKK